MQMSLPENMFRDPNVPLTEEQKLNRKQIYHQITTVPESFSMDLWDTEYFAEPYDNCGTTKCIAGWALAYADIKISDLEIKNDVVSTDLNITREAINAMGLTREEYYSYNSDGLFHLYDDEGAVERMRQLSE